MTTDATPAFETRALVRATSAATLATQQGGQPFASLATPAAAPDLSPLLWLSSLSEHTRHLRAEPRCALLFVGTPAEANPQTAPRVTLTGTAEPVPEAEAPALKARWLARHPYAALYADFGDFALWRVRIGGALLVGGFARAVRIRVAELLPDPAAVEAVAAAEADILAHVNADHPDAVAAIARGLLGGGAGDWRLVALDPDGADLAAGERTRRLSFSGPVRDAEGVRAELARAAQEGRGRLM
jgi:heme oxygenase (biliverdin-IX-beta and delta-forming)